MKKLIIAACATTFFSAAAVAGPAHQRGHDRHQPANNHNQPHSNHKLHRDLFNLALFVGAAFAIDAALDGASDNRHNDRHRNQHHDRHQAGHTSGYGRHQKPAHGNRPYNDHGRRPQANHANPRAHGYAINERQQRQRQRIRQGIKNGSLAHGEAKRLRQQQARIADLEYGFRADGRFTKKERATVQARLDVANERIYRLKHNDRRAH